MLEYIALAAIWALTTVVAIIIVCSLISYVINKDEQTTDTSHQE